MVSFASMMPVYFIARAGKRKSADSVSYEIHWQRNLLRLVRDINHHTLQPTAYTFISMRPKPREVFACDMGMRIVHHYIDDRLRSLIESHLTPRTYNNRKGMGLCAAINQIVEDIYSKTQGFTRDAWCITWDLSGYFPNAKQDIVFQQFSHILNEDYQGEDRDDLRYMVERSVFSYPTEHCDIRSTPEQRALISPEKSLFNKPLGTGGAIGHLIWQNAMNLYTSSIDKWLQDECGLLHVRFVDDNHVVTDNKEAFLAYIMPELRRRYEEYGCTLHPKKFYCQHYTNGTRFCSTTIKMQRVYVSRKNVRDFRACIRRYNQRPCVGRMGKMIASINSYLGICKTRNGHHVAMSALDTLSRKWYRYVHLDRERMCLVANEGYTAEDRLVAKYRIKLKNKKKYDKTRTAGGYHAPYRRADVAACHHGRE